MTHCVGLNDCPMTLSSVCRMNDASLRHGEINT
jgi:hypothetical protein